MNMSSGESEKRMSISQMDELRKSRQEIDRLLRNRGAFSEIMPDMIFLIREDFVIEDMNKSAITRFGQKCGQICYQALHQAERPCSFCPALMRSEDQHRELIEMKIGNTYVECSYAPFEGYRGDKLLLVAMRDVTRRKRHEEEIKKFHSNIEAILHRKIKDLKESEKVRRHLAMEVNVLKKELDRVYHPDEMVGESRKIRELRETVLQVADSDTTILITGESGTGKELIADLIHKNSSRRHKSFLKFNCAAVSESLLESDLFGHEKGAFTGADGLKKGKFEIASQATIFLDEIGDISPRMQAAILRVLQNGEIIRVGGNEPIRVDVRIIAATNANLTKAMEEGRFRRDLYYRLNVFNLVLPPLRERRGDIPALVHHFVAKYSKLLKREIELVSDRAITRLVAHSWPGNIRELENVIQRAVLLAKNKVIMEQELEIDPDRSDGSAKEQGQVQLDERMLQLPLKETLAEVERQIINSALRKCNGKAQQAASVLGLGKTALYDKLKKYEVRKDDL
jgi:transcriptional regulator with GAF, ATPase, and Fis domain